MLASALLAALHHGLAFAVVAILAVEIALVRPGLPPTLTRAMARIDMAYGASFGALVAVGVVRLIWFEKGWDYYLGSPAFWTKIALLALIGLLSVPPTIRFLVWRKRGTAEPGFAPPPAEIAALRRFLKAEIVLFLPVFVAAAMMARGH